jgi:hypothetical protein
MARREARQRRESAVAWNDEDSTQESRQRGGEGTVGE